MTALPIPSGAVAVLDLSSLDEDTVETLRLRQALSVAFLDPGEYRLRRTPGGVDIAKRSFGVGLRRAAIRVGVLAILGVLVGVAVFRVPDMEAPPTEYFATTGEHIVVQGSHVERIDPPMAPNPRVLQARSVPPLTSRHDKRVRLVKRTFPPRRREGEPPVLASK